MNKSTLALTLAISAVLTACGGGGGGSGGGTTPSSAAPASSSVATVASSSVVSVASSSSVVSIESSSSEASSSVVSSSLSSSSSSSSATNACTTANTVQGFASMGNGTTGGADAGLGNNSVTVTNGVQLNSVLSATNATYKDKPLIVYINGTITWANSGNAEIRLRRSNVSIIGMPDSGEFSGVGIRISHGASNIVIRNLRMHEVPQDHGAGDHINLDGQDGAVSNVWIDHNEFYNDLSVDKDFYDELVSGRSEVKNVTISHNYFHDSQKTSLWGSSDTAAEEDVGRTISFHHNHWKDVVSRLPLFRFGEGHIWNNYYQNVTGSGINSRMGAKMRVDNNVFESVKNAIWSGDSSAIGFWHATGNTFTSSTWSGSFNASCATPPCYAGGNNSNIAYEPPYTYTAQDATTVKAYVLENAGRNKINACLNLPDVSASSSSQASSSESSSSSSAATTALVTEDFAAADTTTFLSVGYKANPTDASLALYSLPTGGSAARITFADGALSMTNTRFTIGDKGGATATTGTTQPNGSYDLTRPYRITFTITAATGTGNFQVYVDNNTSTSANSIHTTPSSTTVSRLLQMTPSAITSFPHEVTIDSSVGTANSFFQIRADSNVTNLTIDNLTIEYQ